MQIFKWFIFEDIYTISKYAPKPKGHEFQAQISLQISLLIAIIILENFSFHLAKHVSLSTHTSRDDLGNIVQVQTHEILTEEAANNLKLQSRGINIPIHFSWENHAL